ncbi:gcv3p [Saccharomyces arboricola H-6]|uniref:Glycine cleavage system H protein n=1 Tax=Saccharomyces arboricola (strain H-6 / AS 2.3317 / CBS 10644) TaxID=1160507 RepID=J8PRR4_SACAR|nr:gcv3p [Saccharomyces arboricola H-6]
MLRTTRLWNSRLPTMGKLFLRNSSSNALNKNKLPFLYSSQGPQAVRYTAQHEWIAVHQDKTAFVGITKYATDALGDATYVELPEVGTEIAQGESLGSIESVKSASEIYQPVDGTVQEINTHLEENPGVVNEDPMGDGWLVKMKLGENVNVEQVEGLMSLDQYEKTLVHDE